MKTEADHLIERIRQLLEKSEDAVEIEVRAEDFIRRYFPTLIREVVYPNLDAFRLILCCSQGTKYETFINDLVAEHQKIMMDVFEKLRGKGVPVKDVSEDELHILMSAYTTAMFEPVIHNYPLEKAMHHLKTIEDFFMPGWHDLMGC